MQQQPENQRYHPKCWRSTDLGSKTISHHLKSIYEPGPNTQARPLWGLTQPKSWHTCKDIDHTQVWCLHPRNGTVSAKVPRSLTVECQNPCSVVDQDNMGLEISKCTPPTVLIRSRPNFMRTFATMVVFRLLLFLAFVQVFKNFVKMRVKQKVLKCWISSKRLITERNCWNFGTCGTLHMYGTFYI